jgi:hypothetical protein
MAPGDLSGSYFLGATAAPDNLAKQSAIARNAIMFGCY